MPNYEMINGRRSTHFYRATRGPMLGRKQSAGNSWKLSCGSCAVGPSDDCFRKTRGTGTAFTNALRAGANTRYGKICINISPMTQIWKIFCWTARSCERILAPLERQKKRWARKPGARAQPGRIQHQDPRQCRCAW